MTSEARFPTIPANYPATVTVQGTGARYVSRPIWGMNLIGSTRTTKAEFYQIFGEDPNKGRDALASMGIQQIRFPGGCHGDGYDWRANKMSFIIGGQEKNFPVMPVTDFLAIAAELGAEPVFQLNVETRGYGNPCGWLPRYPDRSLTEAQKTAKLLDDARELLRRHGSVLRTFELGNEPWGSFDPNNAGMKGWPPDAYASVALTFARELKALDPGVRILLVGHPTTGNNMNGDAQTDVDIAWTAMVKRLLADRSCQGLPCFNGVTDHVYSYAGYSPLADNSASVFKGMGAFWPELGLSTIISKRATDYAGSSLALTEWNMKCWETGGRDTTNVRVLNGSFESGAANWSFWKNHADTGASWGIVTTEHHTDTRALHISLTSKSTAAGSTYDTVQVQQVAAVPASRRVVATAYFKTSKPVYAWLVLQQTNPSPSNQWREIGAGQMTAIQPGVWQGVSVAGTTFSDTSQLQLVLRIFKPGGDWTRDPSGVDLYVDDVELYEDKNWRPPLDAVSTVEHGLMVADSYLRMARAGVGSSNYHAFAPGGCGISTGAGATAVLNPQGAAFKHTSVLAGGTMLPTTVSAPAANWTLPPGMASCTGLKCLPSNAPVNFLTAHAGWNADMSSLYVFLINRHNASAASASVGFQNVEVAGMRRKSVVTLKGTDYTQEAFTYDPPLDKPVPSELLTSNNPFTVTVPPMSVVRVELKFEKSFTFTLRPVCATGTPTRATQASHAFWPPGNLVWNHTATAAGSKVVRLTSRHRDNGIYLWMHSDLGTNYTPKTPAPHAAFTGATFFNPPTPMFRASARTLPESSYTLDYLAPASECL
ncbi:hypothetical protein [Cystobacter fuscus]|nr:hypothetical protein [Cystobacter fuscus]